MNTSKDSYCEFTTVKDLKLLEEFDMIGQEWIKIGIVDQVNIYPIVGGTNFQVNEAICTTEGLKTEDTYDSSFIVYKKVSWPLYDSYEICDRYNYPNLRHLFLTRQRNGDFVTLKSPNKNNVLEFRLSDEDEKDLLLRPVLIHPYEVIFIKDCGRIAEKWMSEYLGQKSEGFYLGYHKNYEKLYEPLMQIQETNWRDLDENNHPSTKEMVHIKTYNRYSILNNTSLDIINKALKLPRDKTINSDLCPNITIITRCSDSFKEFTWNLFKINGNIFKRVDSCQKCTKRNIKACTSHNFTFTKEDLYREIEEQLKIITKNEYSENKSLPRSLTVDVELSSGEGIIRKSDEVFVSLF